ncbi:1-acyl-sn-glycerol-3-phosphate acyltransferase [Salibacteraceae bacterium]|jgi:1-acyl-sn-glycerol-3-phosphate acyltransferase|nr:1-acyl-sn-glycerol-3-phosphate acyltransferase [Crocinitomicaceae bacterium]MDA9968018.1 1-acyl-sn-glycerol-3-phosphate acyltransferase [Salibacteraceae bacterium]MDB0058250.1 1-acyl-sn-glycerol-3-phosphate acyltransferase [Salibacteraceae bacterium]|tara:strand:- start:50205 stop:50972 length:768 start_codon:yes stop_codon:yes gene_type:complete
MPVIRKDAFGKIVLIKRLLIAILGLIGYYRLVIRNNARIEGMKHLKGLPKENVLFVSNHQTYFMDVVLMYMAFCANRNGFSKTVKNPFYLFNPVTSFYYVAAKETMDSSLFSKILAYTGAVTIKRTWREKGKEINRTVDLKDLSNIFKALDNGWVVTFPQGTTTPYAKGRKGIGHIIKHNKPIVVPIQIDGFRKAFNKSGIMLKKRGTDITLRFKEPIRFNGEEEPEEILEVLMNQIGQSEENIPEMLREKIHPK